MALERVGSTAFGAAPDPAAPELLLREPLTQSCFVSRAAFVRLLKNIRPRATSMRDVLRPAPLLATPELSARLLLDAVQHAAVEMVFRDHQGTAVPAATLTSLGALLTRAEQLAAALGTRITPRAWWEAKLQMEYARNLGQVHLPLRPITSGPLQFNKKEFNRKAFEETQFDGSQSNAESTSDAGRGAEEAQRLAHQIRHADGVVLITGYRGVGKSTFVNHALFIATQRQDTKDDGWLVVPVVMSIAKSTGVSSVLRLSLRTIRNALLGDAAGGQQPVPGAPDAGPLPITGAERELLDLAYLRATWNVVYSKSAEDAGEWNAAVGLGINPGKLFGGAFSAIAKLGAKRSRIEKLSREINLRDYDEDAAENDIASLTDSLAQPRRARSGRDVRIKLVLVFDELDKLDFKKTVVPLLDGLKNLFLRQHTVFLLVTSKQMYYTLRTQRAVEDATLSSYFSAVVHVPLFEYSQVRALLASWIDRDMMSPAPARAALAEARMLDRFARYLTYKSLGNPRDLIRELRAIQSWSGAGDRPYVTDRITKLPEVAIYALVQAVIEKSVVPWTPTATASATATTSTTGAATSSDQSGAGQLTDPQHDEATLASERVSADQARLEQLRRGLYILVESTIEQQTLRFDKATLEPLRATNFSLYSLADVQRVARELARQLANLHTGMISEPASATGNALFVADLTDANAGLRVAGEFYRLTGRHAPGNDAVEAPATAATRTPAQIIEQAITFFAHGGRAERWTAIDLVGELPAEDVPPDLIEALRKVVHEDSDPAYRAAAIDNVPVAALLDSAFNLLERVERERDTNVLQALLSRIVEPLTDAMRGIATQVLLRLLGYESELSRSIRLLDPGFARLRAATGTRSDIEALALERLEVIARTDVTAALKKLLLAEVARSYLAPDAAKVDRIVRTLVANAQTQHVDLRALLLADAEVLKSTQLHPSLAREMHAIVDGDFANALQFLLIVPEHVALLAQPIVSAAAAANDPVSLRMLLAQLAPLADSSTQSTTPPNWILQWLNTPDFATVVQPALSRVLQARRTDNPANEPSVERAEALLNTVTARPNLTGTSLWAGALAAHHAHIGALGNYGVGALAGVQSRIANLRIVDPPIGTGWGATNYADAYASPSSYAFRPDARATALMLSSVLPFALTLLIPGDVPPSAGFGTLLLARALSLCMPLSLAGIFIALPQRWSDIRTHATSRFSFPWTDPTTGLSDLRRQLSWVLPLIGVFGVPEQYKSWIGPMTFLPQASFFLLNAVAIVLGYAGVTRALKEN